jgi:hypothetical protein
MTTPGPYRETNTLAPKRPLQIDQADHFTQGRLGRHIGLPDIRQTFPAKDTHFFANVQQDQQKTGETGPWQ